MKTTTDPRTQYAHILYREGQYKKWQPCKITIPPGTEINKIYNFIKDHMNQQGIKHSEIEIKKITN